MGQAPMTFEEVMVLTRTVGNPSALQDEEARVLYDLCMKVPVYGMAAEIGCDIGRTSSVIAQVAGEHGYWSFHVDPWTENPLNAPKWMAMMHGIGSSFVVCHMPSAEAGGLLPQVDLLLIDGNHYTAGVRTDCRIAQLRVRSGGVLAIHDYGQPVTPDVKHVVDERITPETGWDFVSLTQTLGVWRRK